MTKTDVFSEFDSVRSKAGIDAWKGKFVKRNYAFEDKTVPKGEQDWFKVKYPFAGRFFFTTADCAHSR